MSQDSPVAVIYDSAGAELGTSGNPVRVNPTGTTAQPVSAAALPLPTGAATETTIAAINTKTPSLGQAAMAASSPVVIASNQSAVPVSGTVTANAGTGPFPVSDNGGSLTVDGSVTVTQATGTNLHAVVDSGTISTITNVVHIDDNSGSITVDGPLTDTQLRASAVPVTGPLTDTQLRATAVPVSAAALPLPSGAATSALQTTGNTSLGNIDTKTPALGQALKAASTPVVMASDSEYITFSGTIDAQYETVGGDISCGIFSSALIQITGTWNGGLNIQYSYDNAGLGSYRTGYIKNPVTGAQYQTLLSSDGTVYIASIPAGVRFARIYAPTWTSGSAAVSVTFVRGINEIIVTQPWAGGLRATIEDGGGSITIDGSVTLGATATTKEVRSSTNTVTSVAAAVADTVILASNANRLGAVVYNDSTAVCYLKLGTGASPTSFTYRMTARSTVEIPFGYTGAVNGYWDSATGNARISELA